MRILLLTFLFALPSATQSQSWTVETSIMEGSRWNSDLRAVSATHPSNPARHQAPVIWAAGSDSRLLKSTDGGQHYTRLLIESAQPLDLRGIQAINEKIAYVMSIGPGKLSRIYKTRYGGETWKLQFSGTRREFSFDALACISETQCFALADPVDGKFVLVSTTDGEHWKELPADAMPPALPGERASAAGGSSLVIYDKREIYFVTGHGAARVFHSPDLGRTWTVTDTPIAKSNPSSGALCITRLGSALVIVGGDSGGNSVGDSSNDAAPAGSGKVIGIVGGSADDAGPNRTAAYSLDEGTTWNLAARPPGAFRSSVVFLDRNTLLAVGPGGEDVSTDQGAHWKRTGDLNLNAIATLDGAAWAAGPQATIVRWTDHTR